jgi:hypothetical protein
MIASQTTSITEVTRRDIRRMLHREKIWWAGDLDEISFLCRLYNLRRLPSTDERHFTAEDDIFQHCVTNPNDWPHDWVFDDDRFQLNDGPDEVLLKFLAEMFHPAVTPDCARARDVVEQLNKLLEPDGWALTQASEISGRPVYGPRRLAASQHAERTARSVAKVVDAAYIHRQIDRMTTAIDSDPDLAIGTAKELIETCCHTILAKRGKPAEDRPDLQPLVRRVLGELKLLPDGVPDQAPGADTVKALLGSLMNICRSLAELRNLYGTGHGKHGERQGLPARHARLAVGAAATLAQFLFDTHEERSKGGK